MHPGIVMVVSAFRQCIQDDGPAARLPGSMGSAATFALAEDADALSAHHANREGGAPR